MTLATVIAFLKKILPMDRIAAFVLGLIATVLALVMGANPGGMKESFCASALPAIPAVSVPAVPVEKAK